MEITGTLFPKAQKPKVQPFYWSVKRNGITETQTFGPDTLIAKRVSEHLFIKDAWEKLPEDQKSLYRHCVSQLNHYEFGKLLQANNIGLGPSPERMGYILHHPDALPTFYTGQRVRYDFFHRVTNYLAEHLQLTQEQIAKYSTAAA